MSRILPLLVLSLAFLLGCKDSGPKDDQASAGGGGESGRLSAEQLATAQAFVHQGAKAHYAEKSDFFTFATPGDLPTDLVWEDGQDQPEIGSPQAKKGGTLNMWVQDFPRTLRTVGPDSNGSFRRMILDDNAQYLVDRHPGTGEYFAMLSESWAVGKDGRTVYFKLRPEARFSDGVAVTADDYLFGFYFMQSDWIKAPWYNNHYRTEYTNITKYDDHTISVTTTEKKPVPLLFFDEKVRPIPEHFYADFGEDYVQHYQWLSEPTTGPYVILSKDVKKGRSLTQTRLKDWWAKDRKFVRYRFNPDKRRHVVMRDVNKHMQSFLAGDFDMYRVRTPEQWGDWLDPERVEPVENGYIERAQFYNEVPRPTWAVYINQAKPQLDNLDIRIGLHHSFNWELILKEFFRGDYSRFRTTSDGYGDMTHPSLQPRAFSVSEAEAAFARAGYKQRGPDGIFQNAEGQRLSFTLTTGYKRYEDALTILEREARKAGVELKLEVLDATAGWKKLSEKKHQLGFGALSPSVEPYTRYHDHFHSYNAFEQDGSVKADTNNYTLTASPECDDLITRYDAATTLDEIRQLGFEIEAKIHQDAAYLPAWKRPFVRCAYWRWIKWPEEFNVRQCTEHDEYHLYWIDEEAKAATLEAQKKGEPFPAATHVFDQFK